MAQVQAIRIRDLRSIEDTGFIRLRPVTVLVGKNSAGKSTFARLLPLLRQSSEETKRTPLLWFGRFVDFGSIQDAVRIGATDGSIEFGFEVILRLQQGPTSFAMWAPLPRTSEPDSVGVHAEVFLRVRAQKDNDSTILAEVRMQVFGLEMSIAFTAEGAVRKVSSGEFNWEPGPKERQRITYRSILPSVEFLQEETFEFEGKNIVGFVGFDPLQDELHREIKKHVHGNTAEDRIDHIATQLKLGDDQTFLRSLQSVKGAPPSWLSAVTTWTPDRVAFKRLRDRAFAWRIRSLLRTSDEVLANFFGGIRYIEPLRATAQRYYRRQELAIDEIDAKGSNVPFYLDSLSATERKDFDDWMLQHFNVSVMAHSEFGHITLMLKDADGSTARNLADLGFGFSQLLPIAIQLWSSTRPMRRASSRIRRRRASCIVMEQPELHLHPEYQARVADVMAACVGPDPSGKHPDLSIVVETHSPSLINRLGQLIVRKKLKPEDVQVVLFEKGQGDSPTTVRVVEYDQEGVLNDWPYGFFEPTVE